MKKEFKLLSNSSSLTRFRDELREILIAANLSEKKTGEVILAMDEVLANISRHGYLNEEGRVEIDLEDTGPQISILVRDFGKTFDPTKVPAPELPPQRPGGLGIYFIKTVMDEVKYQTGPSGENELLLVKFK